MLAISHGEQPLKVMRFINWGVVLCAATIAAATFCASAQAQQPGGKLTEPVYRVANAASKPGGVTTSPLDPAIRLAKSTLKNVQTNIKDYTCTMIKRERVDGKLGEQEYFYMKFRNRKVVDGRIATPMSVYMKFIKPLKTAGRECIYVEGRNEGKILAHEVGLRNLAIFRLDPHGLLAMRGQRYPITDSGVENLVVKLIERGERDRKYKDVEVKFFKGAKINGRSCTMMQVRHPKQDPAHDFHIAQIFIDEEIGAPIRYAAWMWPKTPGGKPELIEEYTYVNMKTNVGLTDRDFDPKNPEYKYP